METTDRPRAELGSELWNWAEGTGGRPIGPTELLDEMNAEDIVFHYYQPASAIVGYSTVVSDRASHGREDDGQRVDRPRTARAIGGFRALSPPVTLADIRAESSSIFGVMDAIRARSEVPRHLALIDNHGASPPNAYISKLPRRVVELLGLPGSEGSTIGIVQDGPKPRPSPPAAAEPFAIDPDKVDRATRGHYDTEEALRQFVTARDARTRQPARDEPRFDLAGWWTASSGSRRSRARRQTTRRSSSDMASVNYSDTRSTSLRRSPGVSS